MPPATRVLAFLLVFTALFLLALVLVVAAEFSDVRWIDTTMSIGDRLSRLTFVAIAITFILVEGGAYVSRLGQKAVEKRGTREG